MATSNFLAQGQFQELRQTLSIRQIQYVTLLQMNMLELNVKLNELEQENPLVELSPPENVEHHANEALDIAKWLYSKPVAHKESDPSDGEDEYKRQIADNKNSITDLAHHLRNQFDMSLDPFSLALLDKLVLSIDKNGYLPLTADQVATLFKVDSILAQEAISYLQTLDPAGIGAFDLSEALLIQLSRKGIVESYIADLVNNHLEDMSKGHFQKAAKAVGCKLEDVRKCYETIKTLNPRPASGFGGMDFSYILPDVTVVQEGDTLVCRFNDRYMPTLSINRAYIDIGKSDKEAKEYINKKLSQALWVAKAIESRKSTIENIANAIVLHQQDFFLNGAPVVPLKLRDIADKLSIHESTVSRAINEKYLECRRGIFPLKHFFTNSMPEDCGTALSRNSIMDSIREIILSEDSAKPYSDNAICKILESRGMAIARRTVAKYREEMGINTATLRKK